MKKIMLLAVLLIASACFAQNQQVNAALTAQDSGSCASANACLVLRLNANSGATIVQTSGTFSATYQFEGTADGANWVAVNGNPVGSTTAVQSATSPGAWQVNVAGMVAVRVRVSTYASGTVQAVITSSVASAAARGGSGGGGSGTVNPGLAHQPAFYPSSGTAVSGTCTVPVTNGQFPMMFNVTADAAVDPTCPQQGFVNTAITGAATSYAITSANNLQGIEHDVAGSQSVTYTLPTPTTLENPQFAIPQICNYSTHTDTLTPTTWTVNLVSSVTIPSNTCRSLSVDPFNANNWLAPTGGAPSGPAGGALCSGSTYPNPLDCTPIASYTFSMAGSTITATPNIPSGTTYSGTDLRAVWDSVAAAIPNGGTVWFKNGTYPCNTLDQESTGGFSNYYCIGIPAGGSSQYAQWFLVGESNAPIIDQFSTPVQTNGVIINVTSTAVASVPAHSKIMGIWARPDATNSVGPSVFERNLDIRVPDNQRGCETESDLSQGLNSDYDNVVADTAVAQNSLVFPLEDTCTSWGSSDTGGLIGLTTTNSSKEENYLRRSYAIGADVGLDIRSEHSVLIQSLALNANHGIDYAVRGGSLLASSSWMEVGCATTKRCLTIGANAIAGSQLNIDGLYFEDAASGSFAPTYHAIETSAGHTFGFITYQNTKEGVGVQTLSPVFDGGGGTNFLTQGQVAAGNYSVNSNLAVTFANSAGSSYGVYQFWNAPGTAAATAKMQLGVGWVGESALGIANKLSFGTSAALFGAYDTSGNFAWGYTTPYPTTFADKFNVGTTGQFHVSAAGNLATSGSVTFTGLTNAATGDYVCYNAGVIEFNTATCTLSLRKYKMDIAPLHQSLNEVMRLRPVEYRYKPELKLGNRLQVGLIADEVAKVDPRIGAYKDNGELESVDYEHMTAVLTAAIQEQQKEIAILKRQVSALRRTKRP